MREGGRTRKGRPVRTVAGGARDLAFGLGTASGALLSGKFQRL